MNIHERALEVAGRFKTAESDLIDIIQEVDSLKAFRDKGCKSTYEYCLEFLKLSDNVTLDFIAVARKSIKVPELKTAIKEETLTVSKARRITSVITPENKDHWLELALKLPKEKLQKEVAKVNPQELVKEKVKYVSEERLEVKLGVSEELMNKLKRAQEILGETNLEKTLDRVLEDFVKRKDPLEKAKRAKSYGPGHIHDRPFKRSPLKANLKHQVTLRDQAQCTHINPDGKRCSEKKWLQVHHVIPISHGGQNRIENLKMLCSGHHQMQH